MEINEIGRKCCIASITLIEFQIFTNKNNENTVDENL